MPEQYTTAIKVSKMLPSGTLQEQAFRALYPEQILYPSLREDKTSEFRRLTSNTSNQLSPEEACKIGQSYYEYLKDISALEVKATCWGNTSIESKQVCFTENITKSKDKNLLYLFGINNETKQCYWSTFDLDLKDRLIAIAEGNAAGKTATGYDDKTAMDQGMEDAGLTLSSQAAATKAIDTLSGFIDNVGATRSQLGANINRLDHTMSNLASMSENTAAAKSRIMDTDMAAESSAMSKNQMLMQAGAQVLSSTSMVPQLAMSLMG